jgi:multiple sugar transport system ATP-binding protein
MAQEIRLEGVTKRFGSIVAVDDVSMTVPAGAFATLVGPSGSGKTTLLRLIAGLEDTTEGAIYFDNEELTDATPQDRPLSMVFQNVALYPHMSCRENIGYGLKIHGVSKAERDERIEQAAKSLQIEDQIDKRPSELSGGQQQRVALGRAFVEDPDVLLLDEPMSDLDAKLKEDLRVEFQRLHRKLDATFVYVTHDQNEAMTMSDRIAVMNTGRVDQFASPESVFHDPVSEHVATFIGTPSTNVFPCSVTGDVAAFADFEVGLPDAAVGEREIRVGVRPQYLSVGGGEVSFEAEIDVVETLGTEYVVHATMTVGDRQVDFVTTDASDLAPGDVVTLGTDAKRCYLFDRLGDRVRATGTPVGDDGTEEAEV